MKIFFKVQFYNYYRWDIMFNVLVEVKIDFLKLK